MNVGAIAVDREVLVRARPETVFRYVSDPARFAAWFGTGSTIEPSVGGAVVVTFPGGARAEGEIVEVEADRRVVFTWGYPGDDSPLPVGSSTVELSLEPVDAGTIVRLTHRVPSDEMRQAHIAGWRHHLSHLATLAARDAQPDAAALADAWCAAWTVDASARLDHVASICTPEAELLDDLVSVTGVEEIAAHIDNAAAHMPGVVTVRTAPPSVVGDQVTWPWELRTGAGAVGTGRHVATVGVDGRIRRIVGFWDDEPDEVSKRLMAGTTLEPADGEAAGIEPHLWTADLPACVDWYERVLGFTVDARHPDTSTPTWVRMVRPGAALMIASEPDPSKTLPNQEYTREVAGRLGTGGPLALYLSVGDVDAVHERATAAGADVIEQLWDPWWGGRQFTVAGPDGVWWSVTR